MLHHNNKTRFVPVIPNIFIEYEPHISCKSIKCQVVGILLLRDLRIIVFRKKFLQIPDIAKNFVKLRIISINVSKSMETLDISAFVSLCNKRNNYDLPLTFNQLHICKFLKIVYYFVLNIM